MPSPERARSPWLKRSKACASSFGKALAFVRHVQLDPLVHLPPHDPDLAATVRERVRDEVVERLAGAIRIRERDGAFPAHLGPDRPPGRARGRAARAAAASTSSPRRAARRESAAAPVRARKHQQVFGQARHTPGLASGRFERLAQLPRVAFAPERDLDPGPKHGQRRAELVAGVRQQPPLAS